MNEEAKTQREILIQDLLENNFTTFFVATHPKYSKSNPAFRFTPSPVSIAIPYSWSFQEARKRLMKLSDVLTQEEAERRNVNFVNPALKDFMPGAALPSLRGGIQMLLPGSRPFLTAIRPMPSGWYWKRLSQVPTPSLKVINYLCTRVTLS